MLGRSRPFRYLAIDGAIGVGKTTLAELLCRRFDAELLLEDAENPFLDDFYRLAQRNALETELHFLLTRYRQLQETRRRPPPQRMMISDYGFQRCIIFADLTLDAEKRAIYRPLFEHFEAEVPLPDVVLHLVADTDVCMERIRHRRRAYESAIDYAYLDKVGHAYERFYRDWRRTPLLTVDTRDFDFPARCEALDSLVERLLRPVKDIERFAATEASRRAEV